MRIFIHGKIDLILTSIRLRSLYVRNVTSGYRICLKIDNRFRC
jgi:hypothetical protein